MGASFPFSIAPKRQQRRSLSATSGMSSNCCLPSHMRHFMSVSGRAIGSFRTHCDKTRVDGVEIEHVTQGEGGVATTPLTTSVYRRSGMHLTCTRSLTTSSSTHGRSRTGIPRVSCAYMECLARGTSCRPDYVLTQLYYAPSIVYAVLMPEN